MTKTRLNSIHCTLSSIIALEFARAIMFSLVQYGVQYDFSHAITSKYFYSYVTKYTKKCSNTLVTKYAFKYRHVFTIVI